MTAVQNIPPVTNERPCKITTYGDGGSRTHVPDPPSDLALESQIPVPLRDRTGSTIAYAVLDAADAALAEHRWYLDSDPSRQGDKLYARRNGVVDGRRIAIYLHREVLGLPPGDPRFGDHVNKLTLDCRRANLRIVSRAENAQNLRARSGTSSRFRGVTWDKARQKWMASGTVNGQRVNLGRFDDEEAAGLAAAEWRAEHMGFSAEGRAA